jgi:hypothetical protein
VALGAVGIGQAAGQLVDELLQGGEEFAVEGVAQSALDGAGIGCCTHGCKARGGVGEGSGNCPSGAFPSTQSPQTCHRISAAPSPAVKKISEAEFTRQVLALAKILGWVTFHARPGRTLTGWRTPVQGDGRGWPDLFAIHRVSGRIVVAELKVGNRQSIAEQAAWLDAFRAAGVEVYIWRPSSWPTIERVLRGDRT